MAEIRIGIVLYPGAQRSAAMGLEDLFHVAVRLMPAAAASASIC